MGKMVRISISVLVGLAFLLPVAIGLMQGRVIEIELAKPRTAKEALQQAYTKHFQEKDYQGAIQKYRWVVEKFPDSEEAIEAQYRIGNVYQWDLVEPEKAIQEYQKIVEKHPDSDYAIAALIRIGESYGRMRKFEKSLVFFQRVIKKYPRSPYVRGALIRQAHTLLFDLGRVQEANSIYEKVLATSPGTEEASEARLRLTWIQLLQGEKTKEKAIEAFKKIRDDMSEPYNVRASAQYMIAFIGESMGKPPSESIADFRRVLNDFPNAYQDLHALSLYQIGEIYEIKEGDFDSASEIYRQGLIKFPKSFWRVKFLKGLQRIGIKRKIRG